MGFQEKIEQAPKIFSKKCKNLQKTEDPHKPESPEGGYRVKVPLYQANFP